MALTAEEKRRRDAARKARQRAAKRTQRAPADRTPRKAVARSEAANGELKQSSITKGIGRYLDKVRDAPATGNGRVSLGALAGFPGMTTDPEVIARAITVIEEKATHAKTSIIEIRLRQRVRDLRGALLALGTGDDPERTFFVAHAGDYAQRYGIAYATFREMGVPAAVLVEAGIAR